MIEVLIEGKDYRIVKLPAMEQFHILRKAAPVLSSVVGSDDALSAIATSLGQLPDDVAETVLLGLLKSVSRKIEGGLGWAPMSSGKTLMYQDTDLTTLMKLAQESWNVISLLFWKGCKGLATSTAPHSQRQRLGDDGRRRGLANDASCCRVAEIRVTARRERRHKRHCQMRGRDRDAGRERQPTTGGDK